MIHKTTLTAVLILLASAAAFGQDWAKKMFQTTSHDFGTLDQGDKAEYEFVFENPYAEEVHIASVHASCGCAKAEIKQETVESHDKGAVIAKFDAAAFRARNRRPSRSFSTGRSPRRSSCRCKHLSAATRSSNRWS